MKNNKKISKFSSFFFLFFFLLGSFFLINRATAQNISQKIKGKILLQVEKNGEAWYVSPNNLKKYYLGRPRDAFNIMQKFGIGITNLNLAKIPIALDHKIVQGTDSDNDGIPDLIEEAIGTNKNNIDTDGDGSSDREEILNRHNPNGSGQLLLNLDFTAKQKGKIFLQVESHGEAWYINPENNKRYFLGRPQDAFNIMRNLGLGIRNIDLDKIKTEYQSPMINLYGCTYDNYNKFNTDNCFIDKNSFATTTDIHIHGGYLNKLQVPYINLFINILIKPDSIKPAYIQFDTETFSNTQCSLVAKMDVNNIGVYNQKIFPLASSSQSTYTCYGTGDQKHCYYRNNNPDYFQLRAQDKTQIPLGNHIKDGMNRIMIAPNPNGCDMHIKFFKLLDKDKQPINISSQFLGSAETNNNNNLIDEFIQENKNDNTTNSDYTTWIKQKRNSQISASSEEELSLINKILKIVDNNYQYSSSSSDYYKIDKNLNNKEDFYLGCKIKNFVCLFYPHNIVGQAQENTCFSIITCPSDIANLTIEKFRDQVKDIRKFSFDPQSQIYPASLVGGRDAYVTSYLGISPGPPEFLYRGNVKYEDYIIKVGPYFIRCSYADMGQVENIRYNTFIKTIGDIAKQL